MKTFFLFLCPFVFLDKYITFSTNNTFFKCIPFVKFIIDKIAKVFEQGLISYKDLSSEILNILRSKRDEIVFKLKLTSKEETEILSKRIEKIESRIQKIEKKNSKKAKRS